MKKYARVLHLWTGLVLGLILVVLGLTGTALSWKHELDVWLNPGLLQAGPALGIVAGTPVRADPVLVDAVTQQLARDVRYGAPRMLELPERAGDVVTAWYRAVPADRSPWSQPVARQVMVDPVSLQVTGERNWGQFGLSRPLLMPTLFHIHRYLLVGEVGKVVVAVTGVALALAVASGMLLWWPRMTRAALWRAVTVRHGGSWPRFNFQLHRAGGLLAAPLLLVSAVSGIHFNMPKWVKPVVAVVAPVTTHPSLVNRSPAGAVAITPGAAVGAAQALFPEGRVSRVVFPAGTDLPFEIRLRQQDERRQGPGATRISIDAGDASVLRVIDPQRARGGDHFLGWMFPLHTGEAFGLPGRLVVSLLGLLPLAFFMTGLVIWVKLHKKKLGLG